MRHFRVGSISIWVFALWAYILNGTRNKFIIKIYISITFFLKCHDGRKIAKFMEPSWGPPGSCRPQMGSMLAPWTLLSGDVSDGLQYPNVTVDVLALQGISGAAIEEWHHHYCDVVVGAIAYQITSLTSVYSTVYSGADQRNHQSSAPLAFVWGIHRWTVNSPYKGPVMRKMVPFDDVIMMARKRLPLRRPF